MREAWTIGHETRHETRRDMQLTMQHPERILGKFRHQRKQRDQLKQVVRNVISKNCEIDFGMDEYQDLINPDLSEKVRFMWTLIVLFCFFVCCYQIVDRIQHYLTYPVAVDIAMDEVVTYTPPSLKACSAENDFVANFLRSKTWNHIICAMPLWWIWGQNLNTSYDKVWQFENYSNTIKNVTFKKVPQHNNFSVVIPQALVLV
uniref:Uncharacterized protein n=1 Tax=Strigamia maritima TaxID=126957 RepID=T1J8W0_STRMM